MSETEMGFVGLCFAPIHIGTHRKMHAALACVMFSHVQGKHMHGSTRVRLELKVFSFQTKRESMNSLLLQK